MLTLALTLLLAADPAEVWSSAISIGPGEHKTLKARGLVVGERYDLVTRGQCSHLGKGRAKKWRDALSPEVSKPFGVDYRVKVAGREITVDADERHEPFTATEAEPQVQIDDRSAISTEARCTLTFVGIRKRSQAL